MSRIIETSRLYVRKAKPTAEDIEFVFRQWSNPDVMKFVGFPKGFPTTREKIKKQLLRVSSTFFDRLLLICLKENDEIIGECKLGSPNKENMTTTDIKLSPDYWGNKYGVEIKKALVDYLFTHTECEGIEASPNINNIASIKMQESVGGVRVKQGVHEFPEEMKSYTTDVHYYIYIVYRKIWNK